MNNEQFKGSTVALVTPFLPNGQIDETSLRQLVNWQIEQGTNVILGCGTTGESATLSTDEQLHIISSIKDEARGRVPVLAGAGSYSTSAAVNLVANMDNLGAEAILSVAPYYNKPEQDGLYAHFKTIAEATSLPVIIYNVPSRTGCNIEAATTLRLAEIPNIIGIKEASGNLNQIMEIIRCRPEGFMVLSGDDALTLPIIAMGGNGAISVIANQTPHLFSRLVKEANAGNWAKARRIHYQLLPLMQQNFSLTNPVPVKTSLAMMGRVRDYFRLPLTSMPASHRDTLKTTLQELELI